MPPFVDLTNHPPFGRLTVLERVENSKFGNACWKCQCSCGNITNVSSCNLRNKSTKSCGCLQKEIFLKRITTHGMVHSPEYATWGRMVQCCTNPKNPKFKDYGGRGITICDKWLNDFMAFFNHVGKRPSSDYSLDRKDNNGNYEPGNVRWTTIMTQNNNNRHNHYITIKGATKTIAQWAKGMGIEYDTLWTRICKYNWHPEKAIFTPVNHKKPRLKTPMI